MFAQKYYFEYNLLYFKVLTNITTFSQQNNEYQWSALCNAFWE